MVQKYTPCTKVPERQIRVTVLAVNNTKPPTLKIFGYSQLTFWYYALLFALHFVSL